MILLVFLRRFRSLLKLDGVAASQAFQFTRRGLGYAVGAMTMIDCLARRAVDTPHNNLAARLTLERVLA